MITLHFFTEDPALIELCQQYWQLNDQNSFLYRVEDIIATTAIPKRTLPQKVFDLCAAYSTDIKCSICTVNAYRFENRSDFTNTTRYLSRAQKWVCAPCQQQEREQRQIAIEEKAKRKREEIRELYTAKSQGPIRIEKLSLENAVALSSFFRVFATENFSYAIPLELAENLFSPTFEYSLDLIKSLFHNHILAVDPIHSPEHAFVEDNLGSFYPNMVAWHLPYGTTSDHPKDLALELEKALRADPLPVIWADQRLELWRKIALHESLQYLKVALGEHGLTLNPGEKTIMVISGLLEFYSVAQIYNMIWRATKDAAAFLVRERVSKQHAANTVIGSIQKYGERARAEKWDIKPYKRHWDCPQSMISQVFYDVVLRIGERGFDTTPSDRNLSPQNNEK